MTFAEIIIFFLMGLGIYFLLKPVQKRLERRFYKFFNSNKSNNGPVIDITNYSKKDKK
jgi:predicted PurR-regulated permease PerM